MGVQNFLDNITRGVVAEYMVGTALKALATGRIEWDACDLVTPNGIKIEANASGYLQEWSHATLPRISFDIAKKQS